MYLTFEQFYTFHKKVKSVPSMTFDLWPDFQGHLKRNLHSAPFQLLKLANFGIFAGNMYTDSCWLLSDIHGLHWYWDLSKVNRGHQRSMTFDDVICHFSGFCAPRVNWCTDFEFDIRLSFMCVEIGSSGLRIPERKMKKITNNYFFFLILTPKRFVGSWKASHSRYF